MTKSRSAVTEAANAVSWMQRLTGEEPVAQNQLVKLVSEGFQCCLARPKRKKEPVTQHMLQQLVASMGSPPTLAEVRLASICLLALAAFLRFDELSKLRCRDMTFAPERMEVVIMSSKTNQYRQGQMVPIARSVKPTCPVAMLRKYMMMGNIEPSSEARLFLPISVGKKRMVLRKTGT